MGNTADTPSPEAGTLLKSAASIGDRAIIETAQQAVEPKELDTSKLYAVLGADGGVYDLDLERFRGTPDRPRGVVQPGTVEAFMAYTERHHVDGATSVWVHPTEGRVVAVLDDHEDGPVGDAGWGEHRAELNLLVTPEWEFWLSQNDALLAQDAFAAHIEQGVRQIVNPSAADMLELAQSFYASTDVNFRSRQVLASGEVRVAYDEKIEANAGQDGSITIPKEFELAIAPFVGEDPYKVMARFRYRLRAGSLSLGYSLVEPELVVRDCLERIAARLTEKFGAGVYLGEPAPLGAAGR